MNHFIESLTEAFKTKSPKRGSEGPIELFDSHLTPQSPPPFKNAAIIQDLPNAESDDCDLIKTLVAETFSHASSSRNKEEHIPDPIYDTSGKLNFEYLLKNAQVLYEGKEFKLARQIFSSLLSNGEKQSQLYYWIGRCFENEGHLPDAINHYKESLTYQTTFEACQCLAQLYSKLNQKSDSLVYLERALLVKNLDPKTKTILYRRLIQLSEELGLEAKELTYLSQLLLQDLAPEEKDALTIQMAKIHFRKGELEATQSLLKPLINTGPEQHNALSLLAEVLLINGNVVSAYEYLIKSLETKINQPGALFHLVKCAYGLKKYSKTESLLRQYCDHCPVNANLFYSLAGLQFQMGKFSDAHESVQRVTQLQPDHPSALELKKLIEKYLLAGEARSHL